jgi:hypothetical protein
MGHESQIELWSPNLTTFCFVGFGTDRLRRQEAMKTADRENPTHGVTWPRNRAHGAVGQNRTSSIEWAEKQEKFQPKEECFFLTSPFIELLGGYGYSAPIYRKYESVVCVFSAECYFNWGLVNCLYNAVDIGLRDDCGSILFLAKN